METLMNTFPEEWRSIAGFEGYYEVSNHGLIRSVGGTKIKKNGSHFNRAGQIIAQRVADHGYVVVMFRKMGKSYLRYVHRLLAQAFIPNPENKGDINHKDGNKANNLIENLEWATRSENIKHSYDSLGHPKVSFAGELSAMAKLNNEAVRRIRRVLIPRHPIYGAKALGREYGVDGSLIMRVVKRTSWKHVEDEASC